MQTASPERPAEFDLTRSADLDSAENPDASLPSLEEDDFGLQDLVPQYLALCRRDVLAMQSALEGTDFNGLRILGHNLKGSGGAYGFPRLTELGARIEQAAKSSEEDTVRRAIAEIELFLDSNTR